MENKASWINKTLESMDNMQRVDVSPQFADHIYQSITVKGNVRFIRPMAKWAVAASIVLLAGLNVFSIIQYKKPTAQQSESNPVYEEYFSYFNNF